MNSKSTNNESPAALLPMDGDKEVELLLRVSKHHRLPGYLIHALESGADAIRRLQVALASQIDISNAERELTRRLSTAPGASESRGSVPDGDDPPLVKLAAVLQALEFEPAAVNHSAAVLAAICRAVAKQAKRAAVPTPPAVSNGEPPDWAIAQAFRDTTVPAHDFAVVQYAGLVLKRANELLARSAAAKGEG